MILPADSYIIFNKTIITEVDKKILVDLYQPIIGYKSVSLYYTLLNDLEKNQTLSKEFTHHHLTSIMQMSLNEINKAREKLEGIGLLETYTKEGTVNSYVYVLYGPLSAKDFLNHPILNIVLYNNVGKKEYDALVETYKVPRVNLKDYKNISLKFDEVFSSAPVNSYFKNDDLIIDNKGQISFKNAVDFELLISGIDSKIINKKAFTKEIKTLINNLSFLYDIDIITMQNLIKTSLNEKGMIDKETLRKSARSFYQFENNGNLPTLIHYTQPRHLKSPSGNLSNKGKMIYTFENTNPYQFLKGKYKGGKVIMRDMKLLEELLIDLKLSPACVNVLIDYSLRVNNQKLNKTYVETIASQWKRLGIKTAEEAMDACIKQYKKGTTKKETKTTKSDVPDWFDEKIDSKELDSKEETELTNLIKKYK